MGFYTGTKQLRYIHVRSDRTQRAKMKQQIKCLVSGIAQQNTKASSQYSAWVSPLRGDTEEKGA